MLKSAPKTDFGLVLKREAHNRKYEYTHKNSFQTVVQFCSSVSHLYAHRFVKTYLFAVRFYCLLAVPTLVMLSVQALPTQKCAKYSALVLWKSGFIY